MEDRDWHLLRTLYEENNITKTAEKLYLSQPAITKRLRQIEKEFGVELVQRSRRGVHFTPEGEYLAQSAGEMLRRLQHIKEHVSSMGDRVAGTLRIGVSDFFKRNRLPGLLRQFKDLYPEVEFKIMNGWSREVFNLVHNQEVHIGFVRGEYAWKDEKLLVDQDTISVASLSPIDLKALPSQPRIAYKSDLLLRSVVEHWWSGQYTVPPRVMMEVDKSDTCKEMVLNGLGYAIMPTSVLKGAEELYTQTLKGPDGQPILRSTWMLYHQESLSFSAVRAFVEFMKQTNAMEG